MATALLQQISPRDPNEPTFRAVVDQCASGIIIQRDERIVYANTAALDCLGWSSIDEVPDGNLCEFFAPESYATLRPNLRKIVPDDDQLFMGELKLRRRGGGLIDAEVHHTAIPFDVDGTSVLNFRDVTLLKRMETDLHQAQKLESVGRLAAGIAHEINTPIQFIGDSAFFVDTTLSELLGLLDRSRGELRAAAEAAGDEDMKQRLADEESAVDLEYLRQEGPRAAQRIIDGVTRVARIVSAMKCFSHPGSADACTLDVNKLLSDTLVVAGHELRAVANVVTDFGDVPFLSGYAGDLNQAFLNLVVNAAHAVVDRGDAAPEPGRILITTRFEDPEVVIRVADTGCGMTPEVKARLFEPFFTTKAVGRGTGQGLPVVHAAIVGKHGGTIDCETAPGVGTTFTLRLPLAPPAA